MQLTNIRGFRTINEYVSWKISEYGKCEKTFATLFEYMFSERSNTMAEISDGYRVKKLTYGEFSDNILKLAPALRDELSDVPVGSLVGIYMSNSMRWIEVFWSVLMCGYSPLLMNMRLAEDVLERIISDHSVKAVISDSKTFSCKTVSADMIAKSAPETVDRPWGHEVVFMSSGTTEKVKLCAYTAENFYYQLCNSVDIIAKCPSIVTHYEGELKHLAVLPFYHVFGFIAVYLWFGFFSRSFVFMRDMNPATLLNTIKKHKVTHIFAVPLVWDKIRKQAVRTIKARGDKTYLKFKNAIKLSSFGSLGAMLSKTLLSEVREGLFGDSVKFLISGGSHIKTKTLEFFNGIGYHLTNGYGMTEIGITSVDTAEKAKILNKGSIGAPFAEVEYSVSETGELLVRTKAMASRIIQGDEINVVDFNEWFKTNDLARARDGRYYIDGRVDDLIVSKTGENINPLIAESKIKVDGCEAVCIFADEKKTPVLLASVKSCFTDERIKELVDALTEAIRSAGLANEIKTLALTPDPLIEATEFKISRKRVAAKYARGEFRIINRDNSGEQISQMLSDLECEVRACFATALEKQIEDIPPTATFFLDLGGSSLDYFMLLNLLKSKFDISLPSNEDERLYTVRDFCDFIMKNGKE